MVFKLNIIATLIIISVATFFATEINTSGLVARCGLNAE